MWLIPTRARPHNIKRLITHAKPTAKALLILDHDDFHNYMDITLPLSWGFVVYQKDYVGNLLNKAFDQFPNEPYYALGADDILPDMFYDVKLEQMITPKDIIWPHDGIEGKCTHPVIGGDLVRERNWIAYPGLRHFYIDTVWGDIAQEIGATGLVNINLNHMHFSNGLAPMDETYKGRPKGNHDKAIYDNYRMR